MTNSSILTNSARVLGSLWSTPKSKVPTDQPASTQPVTELSDQVQVSERPLVVALRENSIRLPSDGSPARLGRNSDSPLPFKSALVSRQHAELRSRNGSLEVRDLKSTNGTYIGDERIEPGKWQRVHPDQNLSLGGIRLQWSSETESPSPDVEPQFVLKDSDGRRVSVPNNSSENFSIGRQEGNALRLNHPQVSRNHAQIRSTSEGLLVQDLGSTNGTYLAGEKLEAGSWSALKPGQELNIGGVSFSLEKQAAQASQVAGAVVGGPIGAVLSLASLKAQASKEDLEPKAVLAQALGDAKSLMAADSGIVDLPKGVPTMVIPDIHAQRDYLPRALEHKIDGKPVLDLLKEGKMNLLCLGDGMHGEGRARSRWLEAEQDFLNNKPSKAMHDEMVESMGTMKMVMDLKKGLGDNFAYLRGNHDDINPQHGYLKFTRVGESNLVKDWVGKNYGEDLLHQWHDFEKSMPLVAKGSGFVASHAAPGKVLDRREVEAKSGSAFRALAWTENRNWAEQGQEREEFEENLKVVGAEAGDKWIVGHRKVENANYRSQFDDQLIQVNPLDTDGFVVAMIGADGSYDPAKDTFKV